MKYKNYKTAIHNFAHSFQSIDYTHSSKLAINVLILLNNKHLEPIAAFDFINKTIQPEIANNNSSIVLLNDYLGWLPIHFEKHNCDLHKLEKLTITLSADFVNAFTPNNMNYCKQLTMKTIVIWQAEGKEEEAIEILQEELVKNSYLQDGIPELNS